MYDWLNYLGTEHRETSFPETEEEIIMRQALEIREDQSPRYRGVLLALGQQLSAWGQALQERYEDGRTFEGDAAHEPC